IPKSLAEREHRSPLKYVQRVQQSLAEIASIAPSSDEGTPSGRWNQFIDNVLSALLRFGYPELALILRSAQQSLAEIASIAPSSDEGTPSGRWNQFIDNVLSALLRFGYPALALILFLGALGLPLPNGLSAVIAGSLAAAGRMS